MTDSTLLAVDDKRDVLTALRLLLKDHVGTVHTACDPSALPALLRDNTYDVVLLDMNFRQDASSGREGFTWLDRIQQIDPEAAVIMITAYGDVEKAVRSMKMGAADFIVKPWNDADLVASVRAAIKLRRTRADANASDADDSPGPNSGTALPEQRFDNIIGQSAPMQQVFRTIEKVAGTDASVLIRGENGTGKELVARALHRRSDRANAPFVTADLGALSESLFESELFGHVKGAFTGAEADRAGRFEAAHGGTLFLDEIGNIPPPLQAKLLTVLQRREVTRVGDTTPRPIDIRLLSATNQPVYEMVDAGDFRQDLLYRINTVEIECPPLRDRGADILVLAEHFRATFASKYDAHVMAIHPDTEQKLRAYHWPGNVRELRHTIERAVIMSEGDRLTPDDLTFSAPMKAPNDDLSADTLNLDAIEQAAVRKALSKHGGNISRAAQELGISRKALYRRIEKYGL
ncbi:MAG: sigma-54 dependent transcriptional regulator [Longimonas sp.]|uniref:sigma-54-dependent transcriptional regulator n=1 Tax=Longimonas sp. TaxID=2039626 RepID=UPI0033595CA8